MNRNDAYEIKIPLPPVSFQQQIVDEIEAYQKVIDGARQVIENYKPSIRHHPDWEMVKLVDVCDKITDGTHDTPKAVKYGVPYITAKHIRDQKILFGECYFLPEGIHREIYRRCNPEKGDVLIVNIGAGSGTPAYVNVDFQFSLKNVALLKPTNSRLNGKFLELIMLQKKEEVYNTISQGGAQAFLSLKTLNSISIPLPPLEEQEEIVRQLEMERLLVDGNKQLISRMEQKIKETIAQVWGEEKEKKEYVENEEVTMAAGL